MLPVVFGRVHVVANFDIRVAGRYRVVEVTLVTMWRLTEGLDYYRDLPAKAGKKPAFVSLG